MYRVIPFTIVFIFFQSYGFAQSFGFGCLGFPGGFGGYNIQKYQPSGLNDYIKIFNLNHQDSLLNEMPDFGLARGYRVGVNFFRKKFSGVFLTGKGFYQVLSEKHDALEQLLAGKAATTNEVKLINWGVGFDLGIPIISILNWKIIDAAVTYNQAKFSNTKNLPGAVTIVENYKSDFEFGYSLGTGIIIEILGEYITLEGSAAYSKLKIDELKMDNGVKLTTGENTNKVVKNFISDGGLSTLIQLNVGIPL